MSRELDLNSIKPLVSNDLMKTMMDEFDNMLMRVSKNYKLEYSEVKEFLKDDWSRDKIINAIVERGYPAMQGSCSELYLEKCFLTKISTPYKKLLVANELGETNLTFLVHPTINEEVMSNYASNILAILNLACK